MSVGPTVSVITLVGRQRERAAAAIASVLGQDGAERCEILLLDAGPEGMAPVAGSDDPRVRVVDFRQRPAGSTMRADAVRMARAPIVAFLEEHARALPGWLLGVEDVFEDATIAGASGEVHAANPGGFPDVVHAMSFSRWLPPLEHGWDADVIVAQDAAYRRSDLLALDDLETLFENEVVLQRALLARGRRLMIDPRVRISHLNEGSVWAISRGYYLWNVSFGRTWATEEHWSPLRKAAQVLGVPWWVFRRVSDMFAATPEDQRRLLARNVLRIVVAQTAGAVGIAVGCLGRDRGADARFTDYELDLDRPMSSS